MHSTDVSKVLLAIVVTVGLGLSLPREASSVGALSYSWHCSGTAQCNFWVTSTSHQAYQWSFGDGSITSISTSTSVNHTYATPRGSTKTFTVHLVGYASPSSGNPDNIIACTIVVGNSPGVGGDPGTGGSCS